MSDSRSQIEEVTTGLLKALGRQPLGRIDCPGCGYKVPSYVGRYPGQKKAGQMECPGCKKILKMAKH